LPDLDPHLVSLTAPSSVEAEQYRKLRNTIEHVAKPGQSYVVAVSSPGAGDGKTITAINLAGAFAQAENRRVLLLDADFRASSLAKRLGWEQRGGLAEALSSGQPLNEIVVNSLPFGLAVALAGAAKRSPYEMLSSPRFRELVAEARRQYDFVVVDTPPLVSVSDSRLIVELVDGIVLVVAAHRTSRAPLEEALRNIDPAKIVGFVLNNADTPILGYPYGYP
jgi:capsular exopolysaccharide synthesis family protein